MYMLNSTLNLNDIFNDDNELVIDCGDKYVSSHNLVLLTSMILHEPGAKTIIINAKRQKGSTSALCQTAVLACVSKPDTKIAYFTGHNNYSLIGDLSNYCLELLKDIKLEFNIDTDIFARKSRIVFSNGSEINFITSNYDLCGFTSHVAIFDSFTINGIKNSAYDKFDDFYINNPIVTVGTKCVIKINQTEE